MQKSAQRSCVMMSHRRAILRLSPRTAGGCLDRVPGSSSPASAHMPPRSRAATVLFDYCQGRTGALREFAPAGAAPLAPLAGRPQRNKRHKPMPIYVVQGTSRPACKRSCIDIIYPPAIPDWRPVPSLHTLETSSFTDFCVVLVRAALFGGFDPFVCT